MTVVPIRRNSHIPTAPSDDDTDEEIPTTVIPTQTTTIPIGTGQNSNTVSPAKVTNVLEFDPQNPNNNALTPGLISSTQLSGIPVNFGAAGEIMEFNPQQPGRRTTVSSTNVPVTLPNNGQSSNSNGEGIMEFDLPKPVTRSTTVSVKPSTTAAVTSSTTSLVSTSVTTTDFVMPTPPLPVGPPQSINLTFLLPPGMQIFQRPAVVNVQITPTNDLN